MPRLVVAMDPVNFEKPYATKTEGVSRVLKSRPPSLDGPQGEKRLTRGYPAIPATLVNLAQPATSYAQWFSYTTADFLSVNREVERALRVTRVLFAGENLRFVADAEMDDQKFFAQVARVQAEFVARVTHTTRLVEVFQARTQAWGTTSLGAAAGKVYLEFAQRFAFTHAGRTRHVSLRFGRLALRLPQTHQALWVLVLRSPTREQGLLLITNVPLTSQRVMREVYTDWRLRSRIEHGYRLDQEQGLDVEDMRVHTLERMRRLFVLVLVAAQFVCFVNGTWPAAALVWLRELRGSSAKRATAMARTCSCGASRTSGAPWRLYASWRTTRFLGVCRDVIDHRGPPAARPRALTAANTGGRIHLAPRVQPVPQASARGWRRNVCESERLKVPGGKPARQLPNTRLWHNGELPTVF